MKKSILILIIIGVFLTSSIVCAVEYTSFKNPNDFKAFDASGVSQKTTDGRIELSIVPIDDDSIKYIKGNGDKTEDNIYKYSDFGYSAKDKKFGYEGYTEVVNVDGEQYVVSVLFKSKMSPSEESSFLDYIKEFNSLNNLKPVEI